MSSNELTDLRERLVTALSTRGFNAHSPMPETTPVPAVWVVPGDPYITHEGATLGGLVVRHQVNFAAAPGTNAVAAEALDAMTLQLLDALDDLRLEDGLGGLLTGDVDRIGLAPINGQQYLAGTVNVLIEIDRS